MTITTTAIIATLAFKLGDEYRGYKIAKVFKDLAKKYNLIDKEN